MKVAGTVGRFNLVGTNMLGDAAGLARHNRSVAQGIQQRRLAVIDMAHNGDNRSTRLHAVYRIIVPHQTFFNIRLGYPLDGMTKVFGDQLGGICVDDIIDGVHFALLHQELDDINCALTHTVGEFLNGYHFRNDHFTGNLLLGYRTTHGLFLLAFLAAAECSQ